MSREEVNEKIWQGDISVLPEIREASKKCLLTNPPRSHSMMLSAYISFFNKQNLLTRCWWLFLMWHHAVFLYLYKDKLSHTEINVLISFLLKFKKFIPSEKLLDLSISAVSKVRASANTPAHEEALTCITHAQVLALDPKNKSSVLKAINDTINLEHYIRQEKDQPQALRQLVRIFRKVGEVYGAIGDEEKQMSFLASALKLALREADTIDQAEKIQTIFTKLDK